jgi:hypothetical protein
VHLLRHLSIVLRRSMPCYDCSTRFHSCYQEGSPVRITLWPPHSSLRSTRDCHGILILELESRSTVALLAKKVCLVKQPSRPHASENHLAPQNQRKNGQRNNQSKVTKRQNKKIEYKIEGELFAKKLDRRRGTPTPIQFFLCLIIPTLFRPKPVRQ